MATTNNRKGKKPARAGHDARPNGAAGGADFKGRANGNRKRKHPSSKSAAGPNKKTYTRPEMLEGIPGVGKLKSSIRQTKRLLAKENLEPGTKIEAERRLLSLTADLEKLQSAREEKDVSVRYHKVKFFERQKLVRKIKQAKKAIAQLEKKAAKGSDDSESDPSEAARDDDEGTEGKGKRSIEDLASTLTELRCLLHYVLRYPPDLAYISLFANGTKEPQAPLATDTESTCVKAYAVLDKIRKAVAKSELSSQPEVDFESGKAADRREKVRVTDKPTATAAAASKAKAGRKTDKKEKTDDEMMDDDDGDDFFARDSDDDE